MRILLIVGFLMFVLSSCEKEELNTNLSLSEISNIKISNISVTKINDGVLNFPGYESYYKVYFV